MGEYTPDIYFSRKNIKVLRYIRRHRGVLEKSILERFGESVSSMLLINLCMSGYLVVERPDGSYVKFSRPPFKSAYNYKYWITSKGEKVLDDRFDRIWQWAIPTLISIAALCVSAFR